MSSSSPSLFANHLLIPLQTRLESHSWRTTEARLNSTPSLPQFRTAITPPGHQTGPIRVHFIHARSPHPSAIPLLLIPPFPLANLALEKLIPQLTTPTPQDGGHDDQQAFHVIIPSLPGIAFSDPLPFSPFLSSSTPSSSPSSSNTASPIPTTAAILNTLMLRLGYTTYLASATAPGWAAPERIDERVVRRLISAHGASCVGAHLVAPALDEPRWWREGVGAWGRWVLARVMGRAGGGYEGADFEGLRLRGGGYEREKGVGAMGGMAEPDTLAYALCDSPVGMLAFVLRGLRLVAGTGGGGDGSKGAGFTQEELVTLASLMWLPGPEAMLRFWAACGKHREEEEVSFSKGRAKPKVAITVFTGGSDGGKGKGKQPATTATTTATAATAAQDEKQPSLWPTQEEVAARRESYCPPAWASPLFDVVHAQRVPGRSSGLLAFEQPEVILAGVRGLAKAVLAKNPRLAKIAPLSEVVVVPAAGTGKPAATEAPVKVSQSQPGASAATAMGGSSSAKQGAAAPAGSSGMASEGGRKGEGEGLLERPSPPFKGPSAEDESPDTLVENTSPMERAA